MGPSTAPTGPLRSISRRTNRMNVSDLRAALADLPDDAEVVVATEEDDACDETPIWHLHYSRGLVIIEAV